MLFAMAANMVLHEKGRVALSTASSGNGMLMVVELATTELAGSRADCRQTASAFMHNLSDVVSLYEGDAELTLSRAAVSLMLGLIENVERDTDVVRFYQTSVCNCSC